MTKHSVLETGLSQREAEKIAYNIPSTPWGDNPSELEVTALDLSDDHEDVSETILEGDPGVSANVITTPIVKSLTSGHRYRISVKMTVPPNVLQFSFDLDGKD